MACVECYVNLVLGCSCKQLVSIVACNCAVLHSSSNTAPDSVKKIVRVPRVVLATELLNALQHFLRTLQP